MTAAPKLRVVKGGRRDHVSMLPKQKPLKTPEDVYVHISEPAMEDAVIGAVLQDATIYAALADRLQPNDFYYGFNIYAWKALEELSKAAEDIDVLTVASQMMKLPNYQLTEDETLMRLSSLMTAAPNIRHAETYARRVHEASVRMRAIASATDVIRLATDKKLDIDEVKDGISASVQRALEVETGRPTDARSIAEAYLAEFEAYFSAGKLPGVKTGFKDLDGLLRILVPEVTILAGSDGMGKTTFLLSIVRNVLMRGEGVVLFSLEMTQAEVLQNLIAMESGVSKAQLLEKRLTMTEWERVKAAAEVVASYPLHVVDEYPMLTPTQARRKLRSMISRGEDVRLCVIDGLWLMEADDKTPERWRDVADIMRSLTAIAKDPDIFVPLLVAHQYSSDITKLKDKTPKTEHLAESAGVRRTAQRIIGMHRASRYGDSTGNTADPNATEIHVLKDRNGSGAMGSYIVVDFDKQYNLYRDHRGVIDEPFN